MKRIILLVITLMSCSLLQAQTTARSAADPVAGIVSDPMTYIMVITMAILLATIIVMSNVIKGLINKIAGPAPVMSKKAMKQSVESVKKPTFFSKINHWLSDSVPVEKEADVMLDHDYDGIKELDNNLPPWWKYGFYMTIFFAFIYMVHYHVVGSGNVQLDEYNKQLADAAQEKQERLKMAAAQVDENTATIMMAAADISEGKKIFMDKCKVCHGGGGEGIVGPNLTDDYWIHGGDIKDVFKVVKYGFPSKGMLSWQGQLSPIQIQQVASFVKTLHGTNPANPKSPQGDLYQEHSVGNAASDTLKGNSNKPSEATAPNAAIL